MFLSFLESNITGHSSLTLITVVCIEGSYICIDINIGSVIHPIYRALVNVGGNVSLLHEGQQT